MAWKGVHLSRPARLNTADGQIVVAQDDGEVRLPLEDVAYIVLDAPHATLTTTLLSACMDAGIVIISVDGRHTPNGIMLPFHSHHRQAGVIAAQLATSEPFRKRCWQRVIVAKIENQAAHLAACGRPDALVLAAMARRVGSGDPDNVEARAARAYWRALFVDFLRDDSTDLRNKLLNYGYAVVRAGIARALVAYGLLPSVGLNHASVTNAFNLADDLVEPFRPFVDSLCRARAEGREKGSDLSLDDRRAMAGILMQDCRIGRETVSLLVATEKAAEGLSGPSRGRVPRFWRCRASPPRRASHREGSRGSLYVAVCLLRSSRGHENRAASCDPFPEISKGRRFYDASVFGLLPHHPRRRSCG